MSPLTLLLLLSLVTFSAAQPSLSFTTVASNSAFPPREYAACATVNTTGSTPILYLFGGFNITYNGVNYTDNYYSDAWSSTNFGSTWTQLNANAAFGAQAWNGAVSVPSGLVYIGGGGDSNASENNQVWYSTDGVNWSVSASNPGFAARENAGIANIPGTGTIMIALGNTGNGQFIDDIWLSTDGRGASWSLQCAGSGSTLCPLINQYGNETGQLHGPTLVGLYSGSWVLMNGYGSYINSTTSWVSNQVAYSSNNFQSYSTYTAPWAPRSQSRATVDGDGYVYLYGGVYNLPANTVPSQIYWNYYTDVWYSTNPASSNPNWVSLGSFASSLGSAAYNGASWPNNPNTGIPTSFYTNGALFNPCLASAYRNGQKQLILYSGIYAGYRQSNPQSAPAWPGVYVGTLNFAPVSSSTGGYNGAQSVTVSVLSVVVAVMSAVVLLF